MNTIKCKFDGFKTKSGHDLRFDISDNNMVIWFLHWGDDDKHIKVGIARIEKVDSKYIVKWFSDNETNPWFKECVAEPDIDGEEYCEIDELMRQIAIHIDRY
jgi:hypothetical protein